MKVDIDNTLPQTSDVMSELNGTQRPMVRHLVSEGNLIKFLFEQHINKQLKMPLIDGLIYQLSKAVLIILFLLTIMFLSMSNDIEKSLSSFVLKSGLLTSNESIENDKKLMINDIVLEVSNKAEIKASISLPPSDLLTSLLDEIKTSLKENKAMPGGISKGDLYSVNGLPTYIKNSDHLSDFYIVTGGTNHNDSNVYFTVFVRVLNEQVTVRPIRIDAKNHLGYGSDLMRSPLTIKALESEL